MGAVRKVKKRDLFGELMEGVSAMRAHREGRTGGSRPRTTNRAALRRRLAEGARVRADRDRRLTAAWSTLADDLARRSSSTAGRRRRG